MSFAIPQKRMCLRIVPCRWRKKGRLVSGGFPGLSERATVSPRTLASASAAGWPAPRLDVGRSCDGSRARERREAVQEFRWDLGALAHASGWCVACMNPTLKVTAALVKLSHKNKLRPRSVSSEFAIDAADRLAGPRLSFEEVRSQAELGTEGTSLGRRWFDATSTDEICRLAARVRHDRAVLSSWRRTK